MNRPLHGLRTLRPWITRNPQTFVPNIFWAKPADYRKALQRVYHAPGRESYVDLPVAGP